MKTLYTEGKEKLGGHERSMRLRLEKDPTNNGYGLWGKEDEEKKSSTESARNRIDSSRSKKRKQAHLSRTSATRRRHRRRLRMEIGFRTHERESAGKIGRSALMS
jgi:hypothetical protein